MNKVKIATHNGVFHTDELIALAILISVYGWDNVDITRTRDPKVLESFDGILVDVGDGEFDHHTAGSIQYRENGIPYASAGLVWRAYGHMLVSHPKAYEFIENTLQFVDAADNGFVETMSIGKNGTEINTITIQTIIRMYNNDDDNGFKNAINFTYEFMQMLLVQANEVAAMYSAVGEAIYYEHGSDLVAVCERYVDVNTVPISDNVTYVLFPNKDDSIVARVMTKDRMEWIKQFNGEKGDGLRFVHASGFMAAFDDIPSFWRFLTDRKSRDGVR